MQKPAQSTYLIKSILVDGQMIVTLDILNPQKGSIFRSFEMEYSDTNLPEDIKKNFKDVTNVHSIISQSPDTCKVDADKGVITLVYCVTFPNGNKFELEGNLQLKQKQIISTKQQATSESEIKFEKLEQDIKKIQEFCENDSKQKKQEFQKLTKDILSQVQLFKERYEEMKHWRKQHQMKYKQLEQSCKSVQKGQGISDAVMHVFDQKLDEHRQIFTEKFQKHAEKVQDLELANSRHVKSIDKLTQQNLQLKKIIKSMETKNADHGEKSEVIQSKVVDLITSQNKIVSVLNNHNEHITQLRKTQSSPSKRETEVDSEPNNLLQFLLKISQDHKKPEPKCQPEPKFNPLFQSKSPKNSQKNSNMNTTFSFASSNSSPNQNNSPLTSTVMQIDPKSYYSKQFINTGKLITYNGVSEQPTQLVGSLPISQQRHSFLSIIKSKRNEVGFGVMSKAYIAERNSIKSPNCIMFHGSKGGVYNGGILVRAEGMGFKQGDKIKMRVNPIEGFAEWSIDGTVVMKEKSDKLKNNQIEWVPFVRVCDKGDSFKWTLE